MPRQVRVKTRYPGVYCIEHISPATRKPEKIYYIRYRKNGKTVEEKAGRQFQDDMTPARAAGIRAMRLHGDQPTNTEKREAVKAEQEAAASKPSFDRLWKDYKRHRPDLKGIIPDENRYHKYLKPAVGSKIPCDLTPMDVDRLRLRSLKDKSPQTVKLTLALLRRIANFGVRRGLCDPLPFAIEIPKVNNLKTEDLSPEQLTRLFEAIEADPHAQAGPMMKMALFTGLRRGELFKLKWEHIDFDRGFISIVDPKGGTDEKIPLNDMARALLESHPRTESPYVFPGRGGRQRTDINKHVNQIKRKAGLPKDFRPLHGLRHVYATILASSGQVDLYTLQKLLTHKSPMMTQRYAHLRDETLRRASNLAGNLIEQAIKSTEIKGKESRSKRSRPLQIPQET
jgi:integrase